MQDTIKRDDEILFQAYIDSGFRKGIPRHLSFNWFIRKVQASPLAVSEERTLVEKNSLTWFTPPGSLPLGLTLIEFEVTLSNVSTARRDFGFIKVKEANLVALISGGSVRLSSSKYAVHFDGSLSFDPEVDKRQYSVGMEFVWYCFEGGQLVNSSLSGKKIVTVASEMMKNNTEKCSNETGFKINGATAVIHNPFPHHIYHIELIVRKSKRQTPFLQTVYTSKEEILEVFIR